ncbi:MAG: TonB-dependent receptor plug domain-containing protein, partial [Gammaproteobacteria bacterium]
MNRTQPRSPLASAIKQALVVGLTVTPLLAAPVHAQNTTSANDAVKAAADAAHAAADAAKAAAEAALVAAEAARSAVEAANGIPPTPRQVREPAAPALQELPLRDNRSVGVPTTPAPVATAAAATAPAVAAAAIAPVLSRGAEAATAAMVITRREIEASGQTLLSEFIRDTAANTNGSFRQSSDNLSQSQSVARLRGLDANNTVVLIDGKRMAGSPTFDAGSASNLNVIPMAAVERIEILSEGASALYGDSAIGGAIN